VNAIPLKGDQRLSRLSRPVPAFSGGGAITGETIPPVSPCVNWGFRPRSLPKGGIMIRTRTEAGGQLGEPGRGVDHLHPTGGGVRGDTLRPARLDR
jgi:hypothetical protein